MPWHASAHCLGRDTAEFYRFGKDQHLAKNEHCRSCPVRMDCLAEALDNEIEWGVWGGLTERERRALLRRNPGITSWKRAFEELAPAVDVPPQQVTRAAPAPVTVR